MCSPMHQSKDLRAELDLLWGAAAIARELNLKTRKAFYLLEAGQLPAKKIGKQWVSSRHALRDHFADLVLKPEA